MAQSKPGASVVLIVEDEPLLLMNAVDMIEDAGFQTLTAGNADEFIELLETRTDISGIFTDIDMPGSMNGLRLTHAIRGRWPPIKIIATSGHFRVRDGDLPEGGRFLPKPYSPGQIIHLINELASGVKLRAILGIRLP